MSGDGLSCPSLSSPQSRGLSFGALKARSYTSGAPEHWARSSLQA